MKRLDDELTLEVGVRWTRPRKYALVVADVFEQESDACLYAILARYSTGPRKLFYIGKTYANFVSTRLAQADHKKRLAGFVADHPHHSYEVSYGVISGIRLNEKRLGAIEQLLIYASDAKHSKNKKNCYDHCVTDTYQITNTGYRCSLPKMICLGVFVPTKRGAR